MIGAESGSCSSRESPSFEVWLLIGSSEMRVLLSDECDSIGIISGQGIEFVVVRGKDPAV